MITYAGDVSTADLILHPVRLRILQAFLGGRHLTTGDLARELPDVAQAGLYRHVSRLAEGGVLEVVSERQARGAVERTYALRQENAWLDVKALTALDRGGQSVAFATFAAALMAAYDRYLDAGATDPLRDGVSYSMNALWLTDEEHLDFLRDVAKIVAPRAANGPAEGRRRRLAASAFFPVADFPATGDNPATGENDE
jgi:DNA-binding transcriptional ArsR family regulator